MTFLFKDHWEKFLVVLAVLALAVSGGWAVRQSIAVRRIRAQAVKVQLAGATYVPSASRGPGSPPATWSKPREQAADSGWLYEVFTPPVVYYHAKSRSFSVTPAAGSTKDEEIPFGLELIGVKAESFRLQLTGFFGGADNLVGAFSEPGRPEILLAREGRRFEHLGLTVISLRVGKVAGDSNGSWPHYDVAGVAVVHDETAGTDVALDSRFRQMTGRAIAVTRFLADDESVHELFEGSSISEHGATYRIERIQLDPPEMTVVRQSAGRLPDEKRVLRPAPADLAKASVPANAPGRSPGNPTSALVSNVK